MRPSFFDTSYLIRFFHILHSYSQYSLLTTHFLTRSPTHTRMSSLSGCSYTGSTTHAYRAFRCKYESIQPFRFSSIPSPEVSPFSVCIPVDEIFAEIQDARVSLITEIDRVFQEWTSEDDKREAYVHSKDPAHSRGTTMSVCCGCRRHVQLASIIDIGVMTILARSSFDSISGPFCRVA